MKERMAEFEMGNLIVNDMYHKATTKGGIVYAVPNYRWCRWDAPIYKLDGNVVVNKEWVMVGGRLYDPAAAPDYDEGSREG